MARKWTLEEGLQKLFPKKPGEEAEIDDLACYERPLTCNFDISFSLIEDEDGPGLSVILTADYEPDEGEGHWLFSATIYPREGETFQSCITRVAQTLGVKADEKVWIDGDSPDD